MPTENWYPISSATHDLPSGHDTWTNSGGANKNASTRVGGGRSGPATHDDDSSYITRIWSSGAEYQALNIDWPGPMVSWDGVLNGNMRHRASGGNRGARFVNAAATVSTDTWANVTDTNNFYVSTGPGDMSASTGRPGGGSWVITDFDDDQTIFATCFMASAGQAVCTSIWGQISYTPPSGSFMLILGLAGLAALPFLGPMTDRAHFERYLDWREVHHPRHTTWAPGERDVAWRDVRAHRAPTYHFVRS